MANQKGGVGKTTFAVNVAAGAAELGYRVLVGDLDPQCNATTTLDATPGRYTLAEVLEPDPATREVNPGSAAAAIVPSGELWPDSLHVLPASLQLADREQDQHEGREQRLTVACEGLWERYDLIVWDLPPSLGQLTINGAVASDEVWVITTPTRYGLDGTAKIMSTLARIQRYYAPHMGVGGIVVNDYRDQTTESKVRLAEIEKTYGDLVAGVRPRSEVINKAAGASAPLSAYGTEGQAAAGWFQGFAKQIMDGAR